MRLVTALRALRGLYVPALLGLLLLPAARLVAQGDVTSHTVRNASGSFLGAAGEVALPVVVVLGAVYLFMRARRRR